MALFRGEEMKISKMLEMRVSLKELEKRWKAAAWEHHH